MSSEAATAPRKRAPSRSAAVKKRSTATRVKRKAPTPKTIERSATPIKFYIALAIAFVVVTSISVFIGTRDEGVINVKATISARAALEEAKGNTELSEQIRSAGRSQTTNKEVDDALIGAGNKITEQQKRAKNTPKTTAVVASTTASTTSATSTDETGEQADVESTQDDEGEEAEGVSEPDETPSDGETSESEANSEEPVDADTSSSEESVVGGRGL